MIRTVRLRELPRLAAVTLAVLCLTWLSHAGAGAEDVHRLHEPLGFLFLTVMAGYAIPRLLALPLPDLFWVSLVAMLAATPVMPGAAQYLAAMERLDFVAMITPVLAYAALGLRADDVVSFRRNGLSIAVLAMLVFAGTFLGSAFVAQLVIVAMGV